MRTHSPLVIDVHEALESPGVRREVSLDAPVTGVPAGMVRAGDVHLDLLIEAIEGGVVVQGRLTGELTGECSRCLEPLTRDFALEAREIYRTGSAWEDGYVVREETIDLDPLVTDNVVLNLPQNPTCRPDCAGLCAGCGANLNEGVCDCEPEIDPRWSALQELRDQLK